MFSIGGLSKRSGVKVPTIRYYEQIGLIEAPARSEGNQRRYEATALERLEFIRHARDLGISVESIRDLILLSRHPENPCGRADQIARDHLEFVRERIRRLQSLEAELARIASGCGADSVKDCYVIRSLSDHALCEADHDG